MKNFVRLFAVVVALAASVPAVAGVPFWVKSAAKATTPTYDPEIPGVILFEEMTTHVAADGDMRMVHRRVWKILNSSGRDLSYFAVAFDKETPIRSLKGWSITAAGKEFAVGERDAYEQSLFEGELFADDKQRGLQLPGGDPGSIMAFEYEQQLRPYMLQQTWPFQSELPLVQGRWSVETEGGWSAEPHWINYAAPAKASAGVFEVANVEAIRDEERMPSIHAIAGELTVLFVPPSGSKVRPRNTWGEMGRWYGELTKDLLSPAPAVQEKAKQLTAGIADRGEQMRAIARFVQREIRYVAIEIGIGGYRPHDPAEVLRLRHGDCKDKAALLIAMLRSIGVDARFVLVNTNRGTVVREVPSATFNHAIVALPAIAKGTTATIRAGESDLLLFDPTSMYVPFGSLPSYLSGNRVLIVTDGGGELVEVPLAKPDQAILRVAGHVALDLGGHLTGEISETRSGWIASDMRALLSSMTELQRTQFFERRLVRAIPGATLAKLKFENVDDIDRELVVSYSVDAPAYAKQTSGLIIFRPRVVGTTRDSIVDLSKRKCGYELDGTSREIDDIEITLPPSFKFDELPEKASVSLAAIRYSAESKVLENRLTYHREYEVREVDVALANLPELNAALKKIITDERGSAVFRVKP